jgi:hypothetical protein
MAWSQSRAGAGVQAHGGKGRRLMVRFAGVSLNQASHTDLASVLKAAA